MLGDTLPKGQLSHSLDEIPIPDASRAYFSANVAGQTKPDANVRQDIQVHQGLFNHPPWGYLVRKIFENLRNKMGTLLKMLYLNLESFQCNQRH